ncbi:MAG: RNA polymerase sigma factor [Vicinamibacterales bacterium]
MTDVRLTHADALAIAAGDRDATSMTEDAFRAFYERTAPGVWAYLARTTGDRAQADDLLQEACYRMLRSRQPYEDDDHRRHALYAIATNLVRDTWRRRATAPSTVAALPDDVADGSVDVAGRAIARADLHRAMARLSVRDRQLLLLAYAHGWSHKEIAGALDLTVASVKLMTWRARRGVLQRLAPNAEGGHR